MSNDKTLLQFAAALPGLHVQTEGGARPVELWLLTADGFRALVLEDGTLRPVAGAVTRPALAAPVPTPPSQSPYIAPVVPRTKNTSAMVDIYDLVDSFGKTGATLTELKFSLPVRKRPNVAGALETLVEAGEVVWVSAHSGRRYWSHKNSPQARLLAEVMAYVRDFGGEPVHISSLKRDVPDCGPAMEVAVERGLLIRVGDMVQEPDDCVEPIEHP